MDVWTVPTLNNAPVTCPQPESRQFGSGTLHLPAQKIIEYYCIEPVGGNTRKRSGELGVPPRLQQTLWRLIRTLGDAFQSWSFIKTSEKHKEFSNGCKMR
jgi:hypothetical protein